MADLQIKYLGIELKNPIIVGSCNLSTDITTAELLQKHGAAAIVYKSLFEEQIQLNNYKLYNKLHESDELSAETTHLFSNISDLDPTEHLLQLEKTVKKLEIPVIASLNAVNIETWIKYAKKLEETGVAAIELNLYTHPKSADIEVPDIVGAQLKVAEEVVKNISIPVSIKLSPYYTNILRAAKKFEETGIKGIVLFNKLYQPDIDIESEKKVFRFNLSTPDENRLTLRYAGLLFQNIKPSICANTGIFTGEDVIKMILAGADAVQVVSTLYKNSFKAIDIMLFQIENWMRKKSYNYIDDFRGKLSAKNILDPLAYSRSQYYEIISNANEIFNNNLKQ